MSILAVDMGSSSCKAIAFAEDGRALAQRSCPYALPRSPHPSWGEMPAEQFWHALVTVVQAIAAEARHDPVEALAISSHAETLVAVGASGRPLAPAILNFDTRATAECTRLRDALGTRRLFEITGLVAHPMYPASKMLWMRNNCLEVFSAAAKFLAIPDYLLTCLELPPLIDYSLASRFLAFDVRQRKWSEEILQSCGMDSECLSTPVQAGTVAGELSRSAAQQLGLRPATPVIVGGHDQPCAAVGCGVLDPGRVSASFGTYECLLAASTLPVLSDRAFNASLNSYCHVVPDRYITIAYFPSGIMLEWFLRIISSDSDYKSIGQVCEQLEGECGEVPSGLCITPHLLGTCNPDFNPEASGVISGIRPSTRRADLYKGILEGIAFEFAGVAELLEEAAGTYDDVYISGGGVHSPLGLRLRAALSGRTLHVMNCSEAVCLGTAILAGVGIGKYPSLPAAVNQLVRVSQSVSPDAALAANYAAHRQQYGVLYSSLAPLRRAQIAGN